ncbi:unnamed protein product [Schistosoma curassoni]|uniref:Restriction endonuclease subunit S n=1 Tax=Schistosoma curassoni TaxID=6186 RepID=A0A183KN97_9TREM|nr:unnamed protein product [Schistosoma curassoni]
MAVRQIKNGKAAGPDNIPAEALKSDVEIWEEEQVPMDWKEGHLVKIPKKGDLSKGLIPTVEKYMELKTTFNQYQSENL